MKKTTLIKSFSFFIALFCAVNFGFGQTTLAAGDIAITGVNSDGTDEFSFVLLKDIVSGTVINFTDNGWQNTGNFRRISGNLTEGILTWVATTDFSCGTEITISTSPLPSSVTSSGSFPLAVGGDQILAYQGTTASPSFIYAINFASNSTWSNAIDSNTSALPSNLTEGINAIYIGNFDNGNYNCAVTSDQSLILAGISSASNWNRDDINRFTLGGCSYTCSACPTTVTWNGSAWSNGTGPTLSLGAELNGNYDTLTNGSFSACSLTVSNNTILSVADNTYVEVQNDIIVDAGSSFEVQPYGAVVQIADTSTVTNNGAMSVTKKTAPMAVALEYTYWSSPVFGETIGDGLFESNASRRFRFNALNFLDATAETNNNGAIVPGQDDIDDNGDDWEWVNSATVMEPGVGYASTHDPSVFVFSGIGYDYTFEGRFNTGTIDVPVYRNDGSTADKNWNFIGNPYPSAISASAFFAQNLYDASTNPSGTLDGAIYYWSQNSPPLATNNGNQTYNFATSDYAVENGSGGTGGGDNITPNGFIPSGQGFFISYSEARPLSTGTVVFNNSMRTRGATDNSLFFKNTNTKSKTSAIDNKFWINLTSDNGVFNQILVAYINGATNNDDGAFYDADKNLSAGTYASLYSCIENSTKKFAIQGKAASSINEDETIQLGFKSTINVLLYIPYL